MFGYLMCWSIALCFMFPKFQRVTDNTVHILFAMGFIFLGILSKAVSVYRDTHTIDVDVDTDEDGNIVLKNNK